MTIPSIPNNGVFINYRRSDTASLAGRIYNEIAKALPNRKIFLDVNSIKLGTNFEYVILNELKDASIIIILIGERWLETNDKEERPRIWNEGDYVRLEIAWALKHKIQILPVLIDNATMPPPGILPPDIRRLTKYNAAEVRNSRFEDDFEFLLTAVDKDKDFLGKKSFQSPYYESRSMLTKTVSIILGIVVSLITLLLGLAVNKEITGNPISDQIGIVGSLVLIPITTLVGGYLGHRFINWNKDH